jgi:hypothetical protein
MLAYVGDLIIWVLFSVATFIIWYMIFILIIEIRSRKLIKSIKEEYNENTEG